MADHRGTEFLGLVLLSRLAFADALNHQLVGREGIVKSIKVLSFLLDVSFNIFVSCLPI